MKIDNRGVTRTVFIFRNIVVKVPKPKIWVHFLMGLLSNIEEKRTWQWSSSSQKRLLCPVVWTSPGGWILIMKKANVQKHLDEVYKHNKKLFNYSSWINNSLGGDDKPENYGYYQGRLVKIDYGQ